MKGKLIVITGLDGSGTTTLARNLHELDKGSHLLRTPDFPFDQGRELIDSLVREKSQPAHYLYYLSRLFPNKTINKLTSLIEREIRSS